MNTTLKLNFVQKITNKTLKQVWLSQTIYKDLVQFQPAWRDILPVLFWFTLCVLGVVLPRFWKPPCTPGSKLNQIFHLFPNRTASLEALGEISEFEAPLYFLPRVRTQPNALWLASIPSHPVSLDEKGFKYHQINPTCKLPCLQAEAPGRPSFVWFILLILKPHVWFRRMVAW